MRMYPTDHAGLEILPVDECLRLLASVPVGRVGFVADGEVVVLPVNHFVDGQDVIFRTAHGSKASAAEGQGSRRIRGRSLQRADPVRVERAGQWPRGTGGRGGRHPAAGPDLEPSSRVSLGYRHAAPVLDADPSHIGYRTADTRDQMGIPSRWHILPASRCGRLIPDPRHACTGPASPQVSCKPASAVPRRSGLTF